jgi:hypothetical protein
LLIVIVAYVLPLCACSIVPIVGSSQNWVAPVLFQVHQVIIANHDRVCARRECAGQELIGIRGLE